MVEIFRCIDLNSLRVELRVSIEVVVKNLQFVLVYWNRYVSYFTSNECVVFSLLLVN